MLGIVWRDFRRHPMALVGVGILCRDRAPLGVRLPLAVRPGVGRRRQSVLAAVVAAPARHRPQRARRGDAHALWRTRVADRRRGGGGHRRVCSVRCSAPLAGFYGGFIDNALMRLTDAFLSFPSLFVLILLSFLLRESRLPLLSGGVASIALVIGATSWMSRGAAGAGDVPLIERGGVRHRRPLLRRVGRPHRDASHRAQFGRTGHRQRHDGGCLGDPRSSPD